MFQAKPTLPIAEIAIRVPNEESDHGRKVAIGLGCIPAFSSLTRIAKGEVSNWNSRVLYPCLTRLNNEATHQAISRLGIIPGKQMSKFIAEIRLQSLSLN